MLVGRHQHKGRIMADKSVIQMTRHSFDAAMDAACNAFIEDVRAQQYTPLDLREQQLLHRGFVAGVERAIAALVREGNAHFERD